MQIPFQELYARFIQLLAVPTHLSPNHVKLIRDLLTYFASKRFRNSLLVIKSHEK